LQVYFSFHFFLPLLFLKANPEFRDKVNSILKRSNSTLGRLSVSRDSTSTSHIEDIDETGSQTSDEPEVAHDVVEGGEELKKDL